MRQKKSKSRRRGQSGVPTSSPLAEYVARQQNNTPVLIEPSHPLAWWRTRPAQSFKRCDVVAARRVLMKSAIIGEPDWLRGVRGDAPTTLGIALRVRREKGPGCVCFDLAMTAVLCVAVEGNAAAALLLSAALKAIATSDPSADPLSSSWLADG
jgi:hypothetical protein